MIGAIAPMLILATVVVAWSSRTRHGSGYAVSGRSDRGAIRQSAGVVQAGDICSALDVSGRDWGPNSFYSAVLAAVPSVKRDSVFGPNATQGTVRGVVARELDVDDAFVRQRYALWKTGTGGYGTAESVNSFWVRYASMATAPSTYEEFRSDFLDFVRRDGAAGDIEVGAAKRALARMDVLLVLVSAGECPNEESIRTAMDEVGALLTPGEPTTLAFVTRGHGGRGDRYGALAVRGDGAR